jgi:hypothetical protein
MTIDFNDLRNGLEMFKTAIGLAKEAKDLLPEGEQKAAIVSSLSTAERTTALAEAQIAKSLGYHLCQCTFPPQIMLSTEYQGTQERFQCPNCKKVWPNPQPSNRGEIGGPDSWMRS